MHSICGMPVSNNPNKQVKASKIATDTERWAVFTQKLELEKLPSTKDLSDHGGFTSAAAVQNSQLHFFKAMALVA